MKRNRRKIRSISKVGEGGGRAFRPGGGRGSGVSGSEGEVGDGCCESKEEGGGEFHFFFFFLFHHREKEEKNE